MRTVPAERSCEECGNPIPSARLRALPDTTTCVKHSRVRPKTINEVPVDGSCVEDLADAVQQQQR